MVLRSSTQVGVILLMEEILHQLIGSLSHYLQGFLHSRWCSGAGFLPLTVSIKEFHWKGRAIDYGSKAAEQGSVKRHVYNLMAAWG